MAKQNFSFTWDINVMYLIPVFEDFAKGPSYGMQKDKSFFMIYTLKNQVCFNVSVW